MLPYVFYILITLLLIHTLSGFILSPASIFSVKRLPALFAEPPSIDKVWDRFFPIDFKEKMMKIEAEGDIDNTSILDNTSIIDENCFDIPLIDVDIQKAVQDILLVATLPPSPKMKPLVATMRGTGGGKSRLLEESKRFINAKIPNSYAIAITFNHHCPIKCEELSYLQSMEDNFIIALIFRIASAHYNVPFTAIFKQMESKKSQYEKLFKKYERHMVIKSFIRHVLLNNNIENFILIVDEIMNAEEKFCVTNGSSDSVMTHLNKAMLNTYITSNNLNAALVVSSLKVRPIAVTGSSGRLIKVLTIPEVLNSAEIVDKWVLDSRIPSIQKWKQSKRNKSELMYLNEVQKLNIATEIVSALPRAIELFADVIHRAIMSDEAITFDTKRMKNVLQDMFKSVEEFLPITRFPSPNKLYCLVFEAITHYDEESVELIATSVFVNSIPKLSSNYPKVNTTYIPRSSIVSMKSSSETSTSLVAKQIRKTINDLFDLVSSYKNAGDILEFLGKEMIMIRYNAALDANASITIEDLLGFSASPEPNDFGSIESDLLSFPITFPEKFSPSKAKYERVIKFRDSSYHQRGMDELIDFFQSQIEVSVKNPFQVIIPHPQECFDLLIVLYNSKDPTKPLVLFIDYKSRAESVLQLLGQMQTKDANGYIPNEAQFIQLKKIASNLKRQLESTTQPPSYVSSSITNGSFLYVTFSTYRGRYAFSHGSNFIVATNSTTSSFFSFFYPLYRTLRSSTYHYK